MEVIERGRISLGYALARSLEVGPDDLLLLLVATQSVGLNVIDVQVSGTTRSFSEEYDRVFIKMPIEDAWTLLDEEYADKLIVMIDRPALARPALHNCRTGSRGRRRAARCSISATPLT